MNDNPIKVFHMIWSRAEMDSWYYVTQQLGDDLRNTVWYYVWYQLHKYDNIRNTIGPIS